MVQAMAEKGGIFYIVKGLKGNNIKCVLTLTFIHSKTHSEV